QRVRLQRRRNFCADGRVETLRRLGGLQRERHLGVLARQDLLDLRLLLIGELQRRRRRVLRHWRRHALDDGAGLRRIAVSGCHRRRCKTGGTERGEQKGQSRAHGGLLGPSPSVGDITVRFAHCSSPCAKRNRHDARSRAAERSSLRRPAPRLAAPRLDARRGARAVRPAVPGTALSRPDRASAELRSGSRAGLDLAVDQDRGCPEDCAYCPQSARYDTGVRAEKLMSLDAVLAEARAAKAAGASRFCMGAAWREPKDRDLEAVCAMVEGIKILDMETCATLGMLTAAQARRLKDAGLDYYNHNLDTSSEFYGKIITTRTYDDRLQTLAHVREAGIHVCCGGIVGMGETREDRIGM